MAEKRNIRVEYAKSLIQSDPRITKRSLQAQLKKEFGVGLSDTTRRQLLQSANTPGVLRNRINTRPFSAYDKTILKRVLRHTGVTPYLAKTVNDVWILAKTMRNEGRSEKEFIKVMKDKFAGFIAENTTYDAKKAPMGKLKNHIYWWKYLKMVRADMIASGEYIPVVKKYDPNKPHRKVSEQILRQKGKMVESNKDKICRLIEENKKDLPYADSQEKKAINQRIRNLENQLRVLS